MGEIIFSIVIWVAGLLGLAALGIVFVVMIEGALPALLEVGVIPFISDITWRPTNDRYGLLAMVVGTLTVSCGALILAGPFAIISAVYVVYWASPLASAVFRLVLRTLAGIPSVVYGLWGLTVLVPRIAEIQQPGTSILAGILVLAVMILPTVAVVAESSIRQQPRNIYAGGLALGLSKWWCVTRIVLPSERRGLALALVLGLARALGETMAIVMVTGNVVSLPESIFSSVRTLTTNIVLEMAYAMDVHRASLFVTGLILMLLVLTILILFNGSRSQYGR